MTDTREDYATSLVWDDHCGFSLRPGCALEPLLRPWREAGVGYLSINIYYDPQPWTHAVEIIAVLRRRLPEVAGELATLGFDGGEITAVLGGNFGRVAGQVWA